MLLSVGLALKFCSQSLLGDIFIYGCFGSVMFELIGGVFDEDIGAFWVPL